jgi:acetate kinase
MKILMLNSGSSIQKSNLFEMSTPSSNRFGAAVDWSGERAAFRVQSNGRPTELQYLSGRPLLARSAIDAVVWWQYIITEKPVEVETTIEVELPPDND